MPFVEPSEKTLGGVMASSICASGDGIHILIVYRYTRTLV